MAVCTTPDGIILWKKIIGGSLEDGFLGVQCDTTTDGNFVIGITSGSTDGDFAGNNHPGDWDITLIKYTPDGTVVWSKTVGGSGREILGKVTATPGGGFIIISSSTSSASGDVTGTNHGATGTKDAWVVKFDIEGNIEWQKLFGGSLDDPAGIVEQGGAISISGDGGYVFAFPAKSIDGDLSGLLPPGTVMGDNDIWLVKINAIGTIVWQKVIGGSLNETNPHLYLYANSIYLLFTSQSFDRDLNGNLGLYDVAIFKYSAAGTLIWKNQLESTSYDGATAITGQAGDQLTITGWCYSTSFEGIPLVNHGQNVILVSRLDTANGTIKWLKSLDGSQVDFLSDVKIGSNNELYFAGSSSSNDYDITGNHGNYDGLIFKMSGINNIRGTAYIDLNANNILDPTDLRPGYIRLQSSKNNQVVASSFTNGGIFNLEVDTGTFNSKVNLWNSGYYTSTPASFNCTFLSANQSCSNDVALKPINGINDLRVSIIPTAATRAGFGTDYQLIGYNVGTTTITSGTISLKKDPRVSYANFSIPPDNITGDSVTWNFSNLNPFDSLRYLIRIDAPPPPAVNNRDILNFSAKILPIAGDSYSSDNALNLRVVAVAAFDPNGKHNLHGDKFLVADIQSQQFIYYVIQFQNTGNAEAYDVIVKDTLPFKLQDGTIEMLASSHACSFSLRDKVASWKFSNINLPDSNNNEPGSHGFIAFRIKAQPTLLQNDYILNRAAIYFDFNPPVITETDSLQIVDSLTTVPVNFINVKAYPQYNEVVVNWEVANEFNVNNYFVEKSLDGNTFTKTGNVVATGRSSYDWIDNQAPASEIFYRVVSVDIDGSVRYSKTVRVNVMEYAQMKIKVNPNPIKDHLIHVNFKNAPLGDYDCNLIDNQGRIYLSQTIKVIGDQDFVFSAKNMPVGIYYLKLYHKDQQPVILPVIVN